MQGTTAARSVLDGILRDAASLDWAHATACHAAVDGIFDRILARDGLLAEVVAGTIDSGGPAGDCESYETMDKLVLWQSADRELRLRLHVFHPGYFDRPHNHRWSFGSRILSGRYFHSLYGLEAEVREAADRGVMPVARFVSEERAGAGYFLDSALVHSLRTDVTTVTLLLRGPAVRDDYFTLDLAASSVSRSVGAERESTAERESKAMTASGFARVRSALERQGLLPRAS